MALSLAYFCRVYNSLNGTNNIWVAYSGGLDSRVLLELCYQYVQQFPTSTLQAIHINHGLQANANIWAAHCRTTCQTLQIPLYSIPIKLPMTKGESLETLARQARHIVWQTLLPDNGTLVLAHHQQDQAETMLYRLFRGTGPTGLAGMHAYCKFGNGILLRPLLEVSKQEIAMFAKVNKLAWIEDESNADCKFARNFLRHTILPALSQRWPRVVQNITRSGMLCAAISTLVNTEMQILLPQMQGTVENTLSINRLLALSEQQCFSVLRAWITQHDHPLPSYNQLSKIKTEVMLARLDANPILNFSQYNIRRYRDNLYLLTDSPIFLAEKLMLAVNQEQDITLLCGRILTIRKTIGRGLVLPNNIANITIYIGSQGKKAKKIFQQHGIPPWQRYNYPLVFLNASLISIVGLWIKHEFSAKPGQSGLTLTIA